MKKIIFLKILLGLCTVALPFAASAQVSDSNIAYLEYKKTMFPLLRKNCAGCHDETAIYPQGPLHSHSDATSAFSVFNRLAPYDMRAEDTKIFKMAGNQHFCKEFDVNCDKADAVTTEMQTALRQYITDVQKSIGVATEAKVDEAPTMVDTQNNVRPMPELNRYFVYPYTDVITVNTSSSELMATTTEQFHIDYPGRYVLTVRWHRVNEDFIEIEALRVSQKSYGVFFKPTPVAVEVSGLKFSAGETEITNSLSGFGGRKVLFLGTRSAFGQNALGQEGISADLPLREWLVPAKAGQNLKINLRLAQLETFPSELCAKHSSENIYLFLKSLGYARFENTNSEQPVQALLSATNEDMLNLCYNIESEVNLRAPQRSVLLNNLKPSERPEVIKIIREFIAGS